MPILYLTVSRLDIVQDERGGQHRQDQRGQTDGLLHCLGGVQGGTGGSSYLVLFQVLYLASKYIYETHQLE